MRTYNPSFPLIFMHVPKTGGNAVNHVLNRWFGKDQYIRPYREELMTLEGDPRMNNGPVCLGGHWPTRKGVLERIVPEVEKRQIFSVVRDVFSMAKSMYTYGLQIQGDTSARRAGSFDAYLDDLHRHRGGISMFTYLPKVPSDYSIERYANEFMLIGVTENLDVSMRQLGSVIGREFPSAVPIRNPSKYKPEDVTDARREEIEALFPREVAFYKAAKLAVEKGRPLGWATAGI